MVKNVLKKISEEKYSTSENQYKEYQPYQELAHAIIAMACADYAAIHHGKWNIEKQARRDTARTFFHSRWYRHMDFSEAFDPGVIMELIDTRKPNPRRFAQNCARGNAT